MNNIAWKTSVAVPQNIEAELEEPIDNRMMPTFARRNGHAVIMGGTDSYSTYVFQTQPLPIEAQRYKDRKFLSRIPVKVGDKIVLLQSQDIVWIQSKGNWTCLHSEAADYDHRMTMADLQMQLDPGIFLRVHRNAIVNMNYVLEFSLPRTGNASVLLRNGKSLPISRTRRTELREHLLSGSRFD